MLCGVIKGTCLSVHAYTHIYICSSLRHIDYVCIGDCGACRMYSAVCMVFTSLFNLRNLTLTSLFHNNSILNIIFRYVFYVFDVNPSAPNAYAYAENDDVEWSSCGSTNQAGRVRRRISLFIYRLCFFSVMIR